MGAGLGKIMHLRNSDELLEIGSKFSDQTIWSKGFAVAIDHIEKKNRISK